MKYDIIIIGGGLSGNMMAKRAQALLPNASIAIIDKGGFVNHSFHLHRPIEELNIEWAERNFFLGIWDGNMRSVITPQDVNQYSHKLYGKLQPSNIINFNSQQNSKIYPVSKQQLLASLDNNAEIIRAEVQNIFPELQIVCTDGFTQFRYKYLINTIPLPEFLKLCGIGTTLNFRTHAFNVNPIKLGYSSGMYQMIYNPDPQCSITRATLIDDTIYIESLEQYTKGDLHMLSDVFNIEPKGEPIKISPGRFDPLPGDERKNLIFYLTQQVQYYAAWEIWGVVI